MEGIWGCNELSTKSIDRRSINSSVDYLFIYLVICFYFSRFLIVLSLLCPSILLLFIYFCLFVSCNFPWNRSFILEVNQSRLKTLLFCLNIKTACFTREWRLVTGCSRNKLTGARLTEEEYYYMNNLKDRLNE
jgi:hypothetical protein